MVQKTTINHFHDKLLHIKDLINTDSAKKIAEERHKFLEIFLDEFMKRMEWREMINTGYLYSKR